MPITCFSPATIASIGWYVYALADEQDRIFYIGKGVNNRVFDHVEGVRRLLISDPAGLLRKLDKDQDDDVDLIPALGEKRQRIAEMLRGEIEPRKYIVREGLTDHDALVVESVLISVLDWQLEGGLTNLVAGHGAKRYGLKTVDELEATKGQPFRLDALPEVASLEGSEVVAININRRWSEVATGARTLLEVSKGHWKLGLDRAKKCRYAIVHANGVVRGVFLTVDWQLSSSYEGRLEFVAEGGSELTGEEFSNKNASSLFGPGGAGSQNPIRYVPILRHSTP